MHSITTTSIAAITALALAAPMALATSGGAQSKLVPNDGYGNQWLGYSVAVSGNTAIVGAVGDRDMGSAAGAAYLFNRTTGQQIAKLLPDTLGEAGVWFGVSVGIDGNTAIVGAWSDNDQGSRSGSAYLFNATTGQQIAKLLASDGVAWSHFGSAVAVSGNIAIVGAYANDQVGTDAGAAYLFDATTGQELRKLIPSDLVAGDNFGRSVAIDGDKAIVGAPSRDSLKGTAYVYDVNTGFSFGKVFALDRQDGDRFGSSVAISGNTALVGAYDSDDNGNGTGSAYLFEMVNGSQLAKLLPGDAVAADKFGYSVGISGTTAVIGAPGPYNGSVEPGKAYLYDTTTGQQISKVLASDGAGGDEFGYAVAISGTDVVVGAYRDDDLGTNSGGAYTLCSCPDSLTLDATPNIAVQGDALTFTTHGGASGQINFLAAVDVNGIPLFMNVNTGVFDAQCRHLYAVTVPGGLVGLDVTFLSIGFLLSGGVGLSNLEIVQFQ